ncbi:hypothetical protein ACYEXS_26320 [Paenibacillus sp. MAH-36]|uniref:Uncharacterized protein n=1 Tax=Paenibacillus violae TaxID=3077234 RepID=A0ABU3RL02_9BACL|nr:hypothetical protein [Paenibacillus sp. PFR10]MDU0204798.1 hypothetical protein [Paenibacillus sp. PFR10]
MLIPSQALEEMGYNGEPIQMYIYSKNSEDAQRIGAQCAKAGIRIELTTRSMGEMMQMIHEADLIFYHICLESEYDLHIIQTLNLLIFSLYCNIN